MYFRYKIENAGMQWFIACGVYQASLDDGVELISEGLGEI
jgi:hypothetical protein